MKLLDDFQKIADRLQSLGVRKMRFSMFMDKVDDEKLKICMKKRRMGTGQKFQEEYFMQLLQEDYSRLK